jgi:hypothetical protein
VRRSSAGGGGFEDVVGVELVGADAVGVDVPNGALVLVGGKKVAGCSMVGATNTSDSTPLLSGAMLVATDRNTTRAPSAVRSGSQL